MVCRLFRFLSPLVNGVGEFTEMHWVGLNTGKVLIHTPDEKEAVLRCSQEQGISVLVQVGSESGYRVFIKDHPILAMLFQGH